MRYNSRHSFLSHSGCSPRGIHCARVPFSHLGRCLCAAIFVPSPQFRRKTPGNHSTKERKGEKIFRAEWPVAAFRAGFTRPCKNCSEKAARQPQHNDIPRRTGSMRQSRVNCFNRRKIIAYNEPEIRIDANSIDLT